MINYAIGTDLSYAVNIKKKAEKPSTKKFKIPSDIKRPPKSSMENIYTDGEFLYTISPFSFSKSELGRLMVGTSFLYYSIAKYDSSTGRFLETMYSHTNKATVSNVFEKLIKQNNLKLVDNPYLLYDLRIMNGYR